MSEGTTAITAIERRETSAERLQRAKEQLEDFARVLKEVESDDEGATRDDDTTTNDASSRSSGGSRSGGSATGADERAAHNESQTRFQREVIARIDSASIRRHKECIKRFVQKEGFKTCKFLEKSTYNSDTPFFKEAMTFAVGEGWDQTKEKKSAHFVLYGATVMEELKRKRANVMSAVRNEMKKLLCDEETRALFNSPEDILNMTTGPARDTNGMYTLLLERIVPLVHGKTEFQTEFLSSTSETSSAFVTPTTEAFALLLIENAADHWWDEFRLNKPPKPFSENTVGVNDVNNPRSTSMSSLSVESHYARKYKYVNGGRGVKGFQGWSDDGTARFNKLAESIKDVRLLPISIAFLNKLKRKWCESTEGNKRKKRKKSGPPRLVCQPYNDNVNGKHVELVKLKRPDGTEYIDTAFGEIDCAVVESDPTIEEAIMVAKV